MSASPQFKEPMSYIKESKTQCSTQKPTKQTITWLLKVRQKFLKVIFAPGSGKFHLVRLGGRGEPILTFVKLKWIFFSPLFLR